MQPHIPIVKEAHMSIYLMKNEIQPYSWGSTSAISELLQIPNPDNSPMAELWMGTHPKAPSSFIADGQTVSLQDEIDKNPNTVLGEAVSTRFDGKLPFLFKVLSAAKPLSIQAHPNKEQAEKGFERENKRGIPIDAPDRNYRDKNHKPEIISAVTPFLALRGFKPIDAIIERFSVLEIPEFSELAAELKKEPNAEGLKTFFRKLMELDVKYREGLIGTVLRRIDGRDDLLSETIRKLNREYPNDIGVLCPLFLNIITLQPGEAMFLPAGELHAYLEGTGIELMANSDNVLRGGLTSKHIDIPELLHVLTFSDGVPEIIRPAEKNGEKLYSAPIDEYALTRITITEEFPYHRSNIQSVEILICIEGGGRISKKAGKQSLPFGRGDSFIVFADCESYMISGNAVLFKAFVPVSNT